MPSTYAGLGDAWERLSCNCGPLLLLSGYRLLSKRYGARCCLSEVCAPLREFGKVCGMSRGRLFVWKKTTGVGMGGLQVGWGRVSRNRQGEAHGVSQVDGCLGLHVGAGRAQQSNKGFCQHFCPGGSCPSSPRHEARPLSPSPCVLSAFGAAASALELRASEFVSSASCVLRCFKRMPGTPAALHHTQPQSLLVLQPVVMETSLSFLEPRGIEPGVGLGSPAPSSLLLPMGVGSAYSASPHPLLLVSRCVFLYVLS